MPQLLIQNGDATSVSYELNDDVVSIGRSPENTVILDQESVSSRHAEIRQEEGRYVLRDLGSSNGTTVNGRSVREAELQAGDCIHFGAAEVKFCLPVATDTNSYVDTLESVVRTERQPEGASHCPSCVTSSMNGRGRPNHTRATKRRGLLIGCGAIVVCLGLIQGLRSLYLLRGPTAKRSKTVSSKPFPRVTSEPIVKVLRSRGYRLKELPEAPGDYFLVGSTPERNCSVLLSGEPLDIRRIEVRTMMFNRPTPGSPDLEKELLRSLTTAYRETLDVLGEIAPAFRVDIEFWLRDGIRLRAGKPGPLYSTSFGKVLFEAELGEFGLSRVVLTMPERTPPQN